MNINKHQFGFVPDGGCDEALCVVESVCDYYIEYGSSICLSARDI